MEFNQQYANFWEKFGVSKKMVLSTSFNDIVTSRMMSIVCIDEKLYFQTDKNFRKYRQIKANSNVALCIDNIQIEGKCEEIGKPIDNKEFINLYKICFESSFNKYSNLENERLFMVIPTFIKRWVYIENIPYMEIFDLKNNKYELKKYIC